MRIILKIMVALALLPWTLWGLWVLTLLIWAALT